MKNLVLLQQPHVPAVTNSCDCYTELVYYTDRVVTKEQMY